MPWLVNLADIARRTGFPVVEQPGWKSRGHGPMGSVQSVICHHDAARHSPGTFNTVIQNGHGSLQGPLAQYALRRDGTIHVVAAGQCWHAGVVKSGIFANSKSIGIEAGNDGLGEKWPEVQMRAYAALCAELSKAFGIPLSQIVGHKEACSPPGRKIDPTFDMNSFRSRVSSSRPGTPPKPLTDDERLEAGMALSSEALKQIYNAVWHGVPGGKLIGNRMGNFGEWPETALGSLTDRIIRQQLAPLRGEIAGLYKALAQLDTEGSVDIEAVRVAAREGANEGATTALEDGVVNVDVNVKGHVQ